MTLGRDERKLITLILVTIFCIGLFAWGVSEIGGTSTDWTKGLFGGGIIAVAVAIFLVSLTVYRRP